MLRAGGKKKVNLGHFVAHVFKEESVKVSCTRNIFLLAPTEKELLQNDFEIPPFTEAFLTSVLSAKGKKTERTSRLIISIAQDLM